MELLYSKQPKWFKDEKGGDSMVSVSIDGIKLAVSMARAGLSATALSEKSGISRQTISYVMNGKHLKPDKAFAIAKALGVDVTEILKD